MTRRWKACATALTRCSVCSITPRPLPGRTIRKYLFDDFAALMKEFKK